MFSQSPFLYLVYNLIVSGSLEAFSSNKYIDKFCDKEKWNISPDKFRVRNSFPLPKGILRDFKESLEFMGKGKNLCVSF